MAETPRASARRVIAIARLTRVVTEGKRKVHTYFVSGLEGVGLHASVGVNLDADAGGSHGAEHVVDLADKLFVGSENHTRQKRNAISIDHSDHLALAAVRESSSLNHALGRTHGETSTAATTAESAATTTVTATTTESATSARATSVRESHLC